MENQQCSINEDIIGISITLKDILIVLDNIGKVNPKDLRSNPLFSHMGEPEIITPEYAKDYAIRHLNHLLGELK